MCTMVDKTLDYMSASVLLSPPPPPHPPIRSSDECRVAVLDSSAFHLTTDFQYMLKQEKT